ncbi:MAG: type I-E CRISPR-associated protein Cse2/CasB [Candidatus Helarchaeota archaeon]
MQPEKEKLKPIYRLIKHLEDLVENQDRAALATCRKGTALLPKHDLKIIPIIFPILYRNGQDEEEISDYIIHSAFLISCLFATWYSGKENLEPADKSETFGKSWAKFYIASEEAPSVESRFVALLDSHKDDMHNHLIHAINLLRSKDIKINFYDLGKGIYYWSHPDKFVQEQWATDFYKFLYRSKKKNQSNEKQNHKKNRGKKHAS